MFLTTTSSCSQCSAIERYKVEQPACPKAQGLSSQLERIIRLMCMHMVQDHLFF